TVEEADAVIGKPMGIPKTGIFGLLDLVGIDLGPHIAASLLSTLPADDAYRSVHRPEPLLERMIAGGLIGRKGKGRLYRTGRGGFSRGGGGGGGRPLQAMALQTGEYRPGRPARLASLEVAKSAKGGAGLRALLEHPDRGGRYAWRVLSQTLAYAAALVPAIA